VGGRVVAAAPITTGSLPSVRRTRPRLGRVLFCSRGRSPRPPLRNRCESAKPSL